MSSSLRSKQVSYFLKNDAEEHTTFVFWMQITQITGTEVEKREVNLALESWLKFHGTIEQFTYTTPVIHLTEYTLENGEKFIASGTTKVSVREAIKNDLDSI